jgi:hypothetical protein
LLLSSEPGILKLCAGRAPNFHAGYRIDACRREQHLGTIMQKKAELAPSPVDVRRTSMLT